MWTIILPLLIYWLVMFVVCFVVVEFGHDQLYDEVTPHAGLKVLGGSLLIAAVLTILRHYKLPASFESMFTTNIIWTVLLGLVWVGVFMLIFQFHPWHALGLGLVTMLLACGLATMGVEALLTKKVPTTQSTRTFQSNQPVRQSSTPKVAPAPGPAAAPAK